MSTATETKHAPEVQAFSALLRKLRACSEAVTWAKDKSLTEVWDTCDRGDWMLWLCGRQVGKPGWPTRKEVVISHAVSFWGEVTVADARRTSLQFSANLVRSMLKVPSSLAEGGL